MCARLGAAHMRLFSAKGMDETQGMCVRVAHMRPFQAKRMVGTQGMCVLVTHMRPIRANRMDGNEGRCVRLAHMWPFRASRSRTCAGFRPGKQPAARKPREVREPEAGKRQETRGSACEMPGNPGRCARTSAGFVPSGRKTGRNKGEVRDSMAQSRGMCVRATHMRSFPAIVMAGNRGMCASDFLSMAGKRG
jgi:hypothetical protein